MHAGLLLALAAVLGWSGIGAAHAQGAQAISRQGGIVGTGVGRGAAARSPDVVLGIGRVGAGTGGTGRGLGNAVGGIDDQASGAGTGGIDDTTFWGTSVGGVTATGRGQGAGSGGVNDTFGFGTSVNATGGINASAIGAGTGGLGDQNSLGGATGGTGERNARRFLVGR